MAKTPDNRLGSPFNDLFDGPFNSSEVQPGADTFKPGSQTGTIVKLSGTGAIMALKPGEALPEVGLYGGPLAAGQRWEPVKE